MPEAVFDHDRLDAYRLAMECAAIQDIRACQSMNSDIRTAMRRFVPNVKRKPSLS